MTGETAISTLSADGVAARVRELGALLRAVVHEGASVSFVLPFTDAESDAFWRDDVLAAVRDGRRTVLVAERAGRIVGTVQLDHGTPPNQPHRAEVRKLLVHPAARRQGVARALMTELERIARPLGRRLLTLDTTTGGSAEPLYSSLGYATVGVIPGFSLDIRGERLEATTVMYKVLRAT